MFNSAVVAVTPSRMFNSAAVEVTPSRMLSSAAVAVTTVPEIENASVSSVPSMSALPLISNDAASNSPVRVTFRKAVMSLLLSTTTALLALTVPAVTPSNSEIPTSAVKSVTAAPEPAPSAKIIADFPVRIVTFDPDPCVIDKVWFVLLRII